MANINGTMTETNISDTISLKGDYSISIRMDGGNSQVQLQRSLDGTNWGIVSYISEPVELDKFSAATATYRLAVTDMTGAISVSYWLGQDS